ncbi:DNA-directed DNA/RNA polymerase mu-like [Porites lutea]|uniref:DNA-directed DNA/RNA polymerase mu-like n=1 Tax=Porites lutea TaxID=51062 RepID=UPI003CC64023
MASKKRKLEEDRLEIFPDQTEMIESREMLIYIIPKKIPKARLQVLNNLAQRKGFPITEKFSNLVTHVVTSYDSREKAFSALEWQPAENVEILTVDWLTDCTTAGKIVDVTDKVRVQGSTTATSKEETLRADLENKDASKDGESCEYQDTKFVCQRGTPLNHHNTKFTDALEILERHAVYVDSGQRNSRALAFRRAACALKSYPKQISRIEEAANLSSVGNHSKKVIQDILENGSSVEVQDILSSDFFKSMEIFSSIYGCGPATARKWYEKGHRNMFDIIQAVKNGMKLTEQQTMGLKYYDDLIQPVPREEAIGIKNIVARELNSIQPNCTVELVGGYRRGKPSGHDVDILITHKDVHRVEGLLVKLVERLDKLGHMVHKDLMAGRNSTLGGSQKHTVGHMDNLDHCFCMFQLTTTALASSESDSPTGSTRNGGSCTDDFQEGRGGRAVRRVDLIVTPPSQFPFSLLGWTGSKQFNRSIRDYAWKILKIKLSNHGMWDHNQVPPCLLEANSEEEIFATLKLEYRKPEDRNA